MKEKSSGMKVLSTLLIRGRFIQYSKFMSLLLIVFTVYVDTVYTYNRITMQILIRRLRITVKFDLNP